MELDERLRTLNSDKTLAGVPYLHKTLRPLAEAVEDPTTQRVRSSKTRMNTARSVRVSALYKEDCTVSKMHLGADAMSICGHAGVALVTRMALVTCQLCQDMAGCEPMPDVRANSRLEFARRTVMRLSYAGKPLWLPLSEHQQAPSGTQPEPPPPPPFVLKTHLRMLHNLSLCGKSRFRLHPPDDLSAVTCWICLTLWRTKSLERQYDGDAAASLSQARSEFYAGGNEQTAPTRLVGLTPAVHDTSSLPGVEGQEFTIEELDSLLA